MQTTKAAKDPLKVEEAPPSTLTGRARYFNREMSWVKFNERVLEEALDERNPLLERVRFLSIFGSNLDEYFMVRVSGLRRQLLAGVRAAPPDGMTPAEQLGGIRELLLSLLGTCYKCWSRELSVKLRETGINVLDYEELKRKQRKLLRKYFKKEIFPVLTPLAFDPGHPFPHISSLSINLAVAVSDPERGERFARLKIPQAFPRLLRIPDEERAESYETLGLEKVVSPNFVWLEQVVAANIDMLFPGLDIVSAFPFRVTRDADIEIEEDEASDLLAATSEMIGQRHFGSVVRLELDEKMPERIQEILVNNLRVAPYQIYRTPNPLGFAALAQLPQLDRPEIKYPVFWPTVQPALAGEQEIFAVLRKRNVLLYHPYDSFNPVVSFIQHAAEDLKVLGIKQTLYRVGPDSPVVQALMDARESGTQVTVLVELKARFDETFNIGWARALERAGVHVVYGVMGLKTHAKILMVVRRERDGMRRYVHLSTGNYNPVTARVYTDLGFFTCDPDIADDVSDLFNALSGYSRQDTYKKLLVAPGRMREQMLARIGREIEAHRASGGGLIAFKTNSLTDRRCVEALYDASQQGVKVQLQVRGMCTLRPGVPGLSDNIEVTSVVGRFLEHSRIYYFRNGGGGNDEVLLGSADLMPRNMDSRVEVLFPVEDARLKASIRDDILFVHLRDTGKARRLRPDGTYERVLPATGESPVDTQLFMLGQPGSWRAEPVEEAPAEKKPAVAQKPVAAPKEK